MLVERGRFGNLHHRLERDALGPRRGRAAERILSVFLQTLEKVMQVVRQSHHRSAQLVLDALERLEIIAAQRGKETLDFGDPLPYLLEVLVLNVEEDLLALEQHRLGAA